jgi:enamine deaminase RidA (YjgF/YER057c/UK114 family)
MENGHPGMAGHLSHHHRFVCIIRESFCQHSTDAFAHAGNYIDHSADDGILDHSSITTCITKMDKSLIIMSTIKFNNPPGLWDPSVASFSHVASVPANSKLIFVAGQGGEEDTQGTLSPDFRTQVKHALNNIRIALRTQGATMRSIVKVTTLVVDHDAEKLGIIVEEFAGIWPDKKFPVNTLIPIPKLAMPGMQVEIDAIAVN